MPSTAPSRSFTRRTSRQLSPSPSTKASRSRCGVSGWARPTAGQASSSVARSKGRRSSSDRTARCGGSIGRSRRAPAGFAPCEGVRELLGQQRRLEVAASDDEQVVGRVPAAEEVLDAFAREARDALARAEDRRAIRVLLVGRCEECLGTDAVRRVVRAPDLFEHHLDLARDLGRVESGAAYHVDEHVEGIVESGDRHRRVVDGGVVAGVRVDPAADALDGTGDFADAAPLGALEEHVLVEVREAFFAGPLVCGTDLRPDLQLRDRCEVGLAEQHRQTIREHVAVEGLRRQSRGSIARRCDPAP